MHPLIGPNATHSELFALLNHAETLVRLEAVKRIGNRLLLNGDCYARVAEIVPLLEDVELSVRKAAAITLMKIEREPSRNDAAFKAKHEFLVSNLLSRSVLAQIANVVLEEDTAEELADWMLRGDLNRLKEWCISAIGETKDTDLLARLYNKASMPFVKILVLKALRGQADDNTISVFRMGKSDKDVQIRFRAALCSIPWSNNERRDVVECFCHELIPHLPVLEDAFIKKRFDEIMNFSRVSEQKPFFADSTERLRSALDEVLAERTRQSRNSNPEYRISGSPDSAEYAEILMPQGFGFFAIKVWRSTGGFISTMPPNTAS